MKKPPSQHKTLIHHVSRRSFLKLTTTVAIGSSLIPFPSFAHALHPLKEIQRTAFTMGSIVTFTCYHHDERDCNIALDEAIAEMKLIDKLMSVFNPDSQLSKVNRYSHEKEIEVDTRIISVLQQAKRYSQITGDAFDITIEPLMELYGFRDDSSIHHFPTDKQIAKIIEGVGINNINISNNSGLSLSHPLTKIDPGGIAVGFAIDSAIGILKAHGIHSALINHSGDIYALGSPPEADSWDVGIIDPLQPEEIITTVKIKDQALSTSGNYENYIEADGKKIGHLLNPRNGVITDSILSATTIAPTAIEADALSTGMFIMGIKEIPNLLKTMDGIRFVGILKNAEEEEIISL